MNEVCTNFLKEKLAYIDRSEYGLGEKYIELCETGIIAKRSEAYDIATDCYTNAIKFFPTNGIAYYNLGKVLYVRGLCHEAQRSYALSSIFCSNIPHEQLSLHMGHALLDYLSPYDTRNYNDIIAYLQNILDVASNDMTDHDQVCMSYGSSALKDISERYKKDIIEPYMELEKMDSSICKRLIYECLNCKDSISSFEITTKKNKDIDEEDIIFALDILYKDKNLLLSPFLNLGISRTALFTPLIVDDVLEEKNPSEYIRKMGSKIYNFIGKLSTDKAGILINALTYHNNNLDASQYDLTIDVYEKSIKDISTGWHHLYNQSMIRDILFKALEYPNSKQLAQQNLDFIFNSTFKVRIKS